MSVDEKQAAQQSGAQVFSFGDPVPVLDRGDILEYLHSWFNGNYYEPPVNPVGLAKSFRAAPHHSSAIFVKRNILTSSYIAHPLLSKQDFSRFALDYLVFGNAYLERVDNKLGKPLRLQPVLAKYARRLMAPDHYTFVHSYGQQHDFAPGAVFHLLEPDINQEIYGAPEYLAGLNSAWLNESATLFRRKYYENGAHAGFIMYISDAAQTEDDINNIRGALKSAKGPGNFRNLFMYAPDGKKDGIQIIPLADVQAKDEFFNVKNVSRDDILSAHRVPPQLMGVIPQNTAGFGDVDKAANVFARNELLPLQERFTELNNWLGIDVIKFSQYEIPSAKTCE